MTEKSTLVLRSQYNQRLLRLRARREASQSPRNMHRRRQDLQHTIIAIRALHKQCLNGKLSAEEQIAALQTANLLSMEAMLSALVFVADCVSVQEPNYDEKNGQAVPGIFGMGMLVDETAHHYYGLHKDAIETYLAEEEAQDNVDDLGVPLSPQEAASRAKDKRAKIEAALGDVEAQTEATAPKSLEDVKQRILGDQQNV